jgi:hypothetical protein
VATVGFKRINAIDGQEGLRSGFKRVIKVGSIGAEAASHGSELGGMGRPALATQGGRGRA